MNHSPSSWQPSASIQNLKLRAQVLKQIRQFFDERNVLEVETPVLCHTSVTDPYIQSIPAFCKTQNKNEKYYLQTSPEYMMKRLLAAGSDSIYQITKAFRNEEMGKLHNPEFTMLEWYRTNFSDQDLMNEIDDLLQIILKCGKAIRKTYEEIFLLYLNINPHLASITELKDCAKKNNIDTQDDFEDKDTWLNLLMTHCIEPKLNTPHFIYDFPSSQAALAKLKPNSPNIAARFELYIQGMEIANGFHELQNATEQRKRFEENNLQREKQALEKISIDENLLNALQHGLPNCSGVALGIDRLIMIAANVKNIKEILSFDFSRV